MSNLKLREFVEASGCALGRKKLRQMAVITGWVNGQVRRMWRVVSGVEWPSR